MKLILYVLTFSHKQPYTEKKHSVSFTNFKIGKGKVTKCEENFQKNK